MSIINTALIGKLKKTKADKTNVLELDNTTVYTPSASYHPATKTYVDSKLSSINIVNDTTPQLGGNLDLNGKFITGTGGISIDGSIASTGLNAGFQLPAGKGYGWEGSFPTNMFGSSGSNGYVGFTPGNNGFALYIPRNSSFNDSAIHIGDQSLGGNTSTVKGHASLILSPAPHDGTGSITALGSFKIQTDTLTIEFGKGDGTTFLSSDGTYKTITQATDTHVSSGNVSGNTLTLTMNDATTVAIDVSSLLDDTTNTLSSGVLNGNVITFTREDLTTFDVNVAALYDNANLPFINAGTITGSTLTLTRNDASTIDIDVSSLLDNTNTYVASGTVTGNTLTLTMNDASTVDIDVSSLLDDTNIVTSVNGQTGAVTVTDTNTTYSLAVNDSLNPNEMLITLSGSDASAVDAIIQGSGGTTVSKGLAGELIIDSVSKLENLSDVDVGTGAVDGQVLTWNGTNLSWEPVALPAGTTDTNDYVSSATLAGNTLTLGRTGSSSLPDLTVSLSTLSVDNASSLNNQAASYYLDYNNFTNVPTALSQFSNDVSFATTGFVTNEITNKVSKLYIDTLNIDADTLDGFDSSHFLDYNNLSNTPTIASNIFRYVSDGVNQFEASGTNDTFSIVDGTNTTAVVNPTLRTISFSVNTANLDADQLDGQEGSYYLDYNNLTNTPSIPVSLDDLSDVDLTTTAPQIGQVLKYDGIRFVPSSDSVGTTGGSGLNYSQSYVTEDQYIGDSSTVSFALSQLPTSEAHVIASINGVVQDPSQYSISGTTITFTTAPGPSTIIDIRTIKATTTSVELMDGHIFTFTISTPTTGISGADDRGDTLIYQPERLQVYVNGIMLVPDVDYGAINGNSISFNDTIPTGSTVQVVTNSLAQIQSQAPISGDEVILLTDTTGVVATFDASVYRTAKFIAQITHASGGYHSVEAMVIHDGTNVYMHTYGDIFTITSLGTLDASLNGNTFELSFTPNTGLTNCSVRTKWIAVEV